jgi:hypothetical protein
VWKNGPKFFHSVEKVFHGVEELACFFHTMEKVFADFPHNGKNVSTAWKSGV